MTPQERIEFNKMKEQLDAMRSARDIVFISELTRRLASSSLTIDTGSLTSTTIAVRNAADTGSESVADDYDGVINLKDGIGNVYRIGYYT